MAVAANTQIYGIREALKEINSFDRRYRRQITKDIQGGAGVMLVSAARQEIPTIPPLTGMRRGNLIKGRDGTKWSTANAQAGIKTIVARAGSKAKSVTFSTGETVSYGARPFALLVLRQQDAAAAIWDHAGIKGLRSNFVTNLTTYAKDGRKQAPRAMEPAAESVRPGVEREVAKIVNEVGEAINRNLKLETKGP
jgi:hypothetical protein